MRRRQSLNHWLASDGAEVSPCSVRRPVAQAFELATQR